MDLRASHQNEKCVYKIHKLIYHSLFYTKHPEIINKLAAPVIRVCRYRLRGTSDAHLFLVVGV